MSRVPKPDADQIREFVDDLRSKPFLPQRNRWWPKYLFHFTDLKNAVNILTTGELLSRNLAISKGLMVNDNANLVIIGRTQEFTRSHARLYFRPRTPTQFNSEGIKPLVYRDECHCPVPILLLFDAKEVLSTEGTLFSDGNMVRTESKLGSNVDFLRRIPFEYVYHDQAFPDHMKATIIRHRNAEVLIPNKLPLAQLKYIVCRSEAEFETLRTCLNGPINYKWRKSIIIRKAPFVLNWPFVESVVLSSTDAHFTFYIPNDSTRIGPYNLRLELEDMASKQTGSTEMPNFRIPRSGQGFRFKSSAYQIRLFLDGSLAYQSDYVDFDDFL